MAGSANPSGGGGGGGANNANPSLLSAAASTMSTRRSIMRACYGGTETMRLQGENFLPKYERESQTRYDARLNSTFALNKLREAVDAASAKPFKTILKIENNTDADLDLWVQDIDLKGTHLHLFAHKFFNDAMLDGQSHIFIDHPDTADMPNLQVQQASGARPFMKQILDQDLLAAYTEYVGGDTKVVHCRIQGSRIERTPDFKEVVWNQIWVIEQEPGTTNGVVQLWEQKAGSGGGQWTLMGEKPITLDEVPLVTLNAGDKESDFVTRPVFLDLAYKQIEHWISSSDQRSILAAARFPMLACSGVTIDPEDEQQFAIGPYKVLYAPDAQGRWYFVEPKGTAIESGLKDLEMLELQMDMMALNPVTGTHRQYVPQNERDIQETRVHSVVHDLAIGCKDALERAIMFMGMWANKDFSQVSVTLNTEFNNTKDKVQEIVQLVALWEKRGIRREVLYNELKNRNLLSENFTVAEELAFFTQVDAVLESSAAGGTAAPGQTSPTPQPSSTPSASATPAKNDFPNGQVRPTRQI